MAIAGFLLGGFLGFLSAAFAMVFLGFGWVEAGGLYLSISLASPILLIVFGLLRMAPRRAAAPEFEAKPAWERVAAHVPRP